MGNEFSIDFTYKDELATGVHINIGHGVSIDAQLSNVSRTEAARSNANLRKEFNGESWDNSMDPKMKKVYDSFEGGNQAETALAFMQNTFAESGVSGRVDSVSVKGPNGQVHSTGNAQMIAFGSTLTTTTNINEREIYAELSGLSKAEAEHLREYFKNNPDANQQFIKLYDSVAADGKITSAEKALVNNVTEQGLIKAGVSADVSSVGLTHYIHPKM